MFLSDNGPWLTYGNHAGNTGGFREGKGTAWEGGVRVPFVVRWPGKVPAGTVCNRMVASMDVLPTIAQICKVALPAKKIDGVNILPLLTGDMEANPRDEFAYYYNVNSLKGIRKGQYKLVFPSTSQTYKKTAMGSDGFPGKFASDTVMLALYDLRTDPGETVDVKEKHPEIVQELTSVADKYREELGDMLTGKTGSGIRPPAKVEQAF
jgi:arylsulfatase